MGSLETLQYYSTVCVCVCVWISMYSTMATSWMQSVSLCGSTPSSGKCAGDISLLKLKRQFLSTFTLLDPRGQCSVRGCRESVMEPEVLLLWHSLLVQLVASKEPRKSLQNSYITGKKGTYICICMLISLSGKHSFSINLGPSYFSLGFNWKKMITLNDCFHRRQLAWLVRGKLPTRPSDRLVLLTLHWSSRRRPCKRIRGWGFFRYLFHQPTNPLLLLFCRICQ